MCVAQNAPDRSDQPFDKAILPRRSWCDRLVPDAHGARSACDHRTVDPIAIPDHVNRSFIPRKRLGDLTRNPLRRRIGCDVDPDEISAIKPYTRAPPGSSLQPILACPTLRSFG